VEKTEDLILADTDTEERVSNRHLRQQAQCIALVMLTVSLEERSMPRKPKYFMVPFLSLGTAEGALVTGCDLGS
jgi:hypothetical protein